MRILSLDYDPLFGEVATRSSFSSDLSAFDYDVVIWDPEASFESYRSYGEEPYMGLPCLSDTESSLIQADTKRRRAEFKDFIEAGRTLIVIARPPQSCYVATGKVEFSGTGRSARRTRTVTNFDILSALPIDDPGFQKARGDRIGVIGDGPLVSLTRKYLSHLAYSATLATPPGTAFAKVAGTSRIVGSFLRTKSGGLLLVLPDTTFKREYDEKGEHEHWPEEAAQYQMDLIEAVESISGQSEVARPSWAANYSTEKEREVRSAVAKQQAAIEKAREKLTSLQAEAELIELRDQLYLGTGRQLELRVRDALEQLGVVVTEPTPGRDDWRAEFDGKPAVLEVKGVSKSAAEKHAAQLEKWVAGAFEETGKMPKGILIVNAWRETPLADRNSDSFPAQMLPYSESRQHCLMTGLDLFAIACEVDQDPSKKRFWRDKIMSTSGILTDVPDWRQYIQQTTTAVEGQEKP